MNTYDQGGYPAGITNARFGINKSPQPRIPAKPASIFDTIFNGTLHSGEYTYDRHGKGALELELLVISLDPSPEGMDDAAIETVEQFLAELKRERAERRAECEVR